MKVRLVIIALAVLAAGVFSVPRESDAAFHIMRVWGVGGGVYANSQIQWAELRMPSAGQNFIANHQVCFFDASGTPKARLNFTASAPNGPNGASILMGTSEFDSAWAAGSPDFVFGGAGSTMTSLNGGDVNHPVQFPAGKVGFGDYDASCAPGGGFGVIDSVAYGTGYAGPVDFGTKFNMNLPTTGTQGIKLTGPFCHPFGGPCNQQNQSDYSIVNVNTPVGNQPRNNVPLQGPLGAIIRTGSDYYETQPGTFQDFAADPIPLNFFDPGSQPFADNVPLIGDPLGSPLGSADTVVSRLATGDLTVPFPSQDVVPIELVSLSLVSMTPITVNYGGPTETWDVAVSLNPGSPSLGNMTIDGVDANGGTFDTSIQVYPRFTFTRISDSAVRVLDYGPQTFTATDSPWRYTCPAVGILSGPQSVNFCASADTSMRVLTTLVAPDAEQAVLPACGDADNDGVDDCAPDNCPNTANPGQEDNDGDSQGDACDTDDDNDTVLDVSDNCQFIANMNQANFDVDTLGDVCDPDDDNDLLPDASDTDDDNDKVTDVDEAACGGTTPSLLRPERIDGIFATVDDDGDTVADEALPGGTANFDCDGDGYRGSAETHVYQPATTGDQDPCGGTGWPGDHVPGGFGPNRLNVQDLSSYIAPTRHINTDVGDNPGNVRWDVVPGGGVLPDINVQDLVSISIVVPPMLGVRAFNGPVCPWAP